MPQKTQVVDITKSYLPGDPNSYVQSLVNTDREDGEEKTLPVMAFDGYNFLPTAYGYRSYFGINESIDISALASRPQFVLLFQLSNYQSRLIALCEDGIWVADPHTAAASWSQEVTFYLTGTEPVPGDPTYDPLVMEEWTWCVIENVLYMYQQGRSSAWKTGEAAGEITISTHTPSYLNMSTQMGIFKAGNRLSFWDSDNSVSWSSNLDLTDFTPSVENLAGFTVFGDVVGRIVTIKQQGEGFVIYCTKSIVGVTYSTEGNLLWGSRKILSDVGVYHSRAISYGSSDTEHVAYTNSGIFLIGKYSAIDRKHAVEPIATDFYDYMKESRDPVYVDTMNSRFVFFSVIDPNYITGTLFTEESTVNDLKVNFTLGGEDWNGEDLPAISLNCVQAANAIKYLVTFGFVTTYDTSALWSIVVSETQDGTNGPIANGVGSRDAETPGFDTSDVEALMVGGTLPAELDPTAAPWGSSSDIYLGNIPQAGVTVMNARSDSLVQMMYKQMADWELFKIHQVASVAILEAASKVTTTPGVTLYYSSTNAPLPDLPATTVVDSSAGSFRTGDGNVEIQVAEELRTLYMRKYFQRAYPVTKRVTTSYVWRLNSNAVSGYEFLYTGTVNKAQVWFGSPDSFTLTIALAWPDQGTEADTWTAALSDLTAQLLADAPATTQYSSYGTIPKVSALIDSGYTGNRIFVYYDNSAYPAGPSGAGSPVVAYGGNNLGDISTAQTISSWYMDTVETITYHVETPVTQDEGYDTFEATQVAYGRTTVQVTSSPPTIVLHSPVPIFPTGATAASFFPPAWNGEETLLLIAASAYSPWHLADGSFGIELNVGEAVAGASAPSVNEVCEIDSPPMILTDYDGLYSGTSFLLQIGSGAPLYPMFEGAYVLDLQLKKWGKMKNVFRVLTSLEAVNQASYEVLIADNKGMDASLMSYDGLLNVFDDTPTDSTITYGKMGFFRQGMTDILEVKLYMRDARSGSLVVKTSMDGRTIDATKSYTLAFSNATIVEGYPDLSGRWHTVTISGNYDLTGQEFRATIAGRR